MRGCLFAVALLGCSESGTRPSDALACGTAMLTGDVDGETIDSLSVAAYEQDTGDSIYISDQGTHCEPILNDDHLDIATCSSRFTPGVTPLGGDGTACASEQSPTSALFFASEATQQLLFISFNGTLTIDRIEADCVRGSFTATFETHGFQQLDGVFAADLCAVGTP